MLNEAEIIAVLMLKSHAKLMLSAKLQFVISIL